MSGHFGQRLPTELPNGVDGSQDAGDDQAHEHLLEPPGASDGARQGFSSSPSPTAAIKTRPSAHVQVRAPALMTFGSPTKVLAKRMFGSTTRHHGAQTRSQQCNKMHL